MKLEDQMRVEYSFGLYSILQFDRVWVWKPMRLRCVVVVTLEAVHHIRIDLDIWVKTGLQFFIFYTAKIQIIPVRKPHQTFLRNINFRFEFPASMIDSSFLNIWSRKECFILKCSRMNSEFRIWDQI